MLNLKKILWIPIILCAPATTIIGFASCTNNRSSLYNANGTNWAGVEKGHFDESDYDINNEQKTITYKNGNKIMSTDLVIPDYVHIHNTPYKVFLGDKCFYHNSLLKGDVQLNKFATEVPNQCFCSCFMLSSVTFKSNIQKVGYQAFYECLGLRHINSENGFFYFLNSIGDEAFYKCELANTDLMFGPSLTQLGKRAFYGCWGVQNISLISAANVSVVPKGCFAGCNAVNYVVLGESISTIDDEAFLSCTELKEVLLPMRDMHFIIGNNAFQSCNKFKGFDLKCTFKSIGKSSFASCFALENINDIITSDDEESLTVIPNNAFNSCSNIKYLKFPKNISYVYDSSFANCTNLTTIDVSSYDNEKTIQFVGNGVFSNCGQTGNIFYNINTSLESWKQIFKKTGINVLPGGWNFIPIEN